MNNNKLNIDKYTKELVGKAEVQQPGSDFTKNVMKQLLKDPEVKVSFITADDKKSNFWLIISMIIMVTGFFIFYYIKYGLNFTKVTEEFKSSGYLKAFSDFFSELWTELTISPYILIALVGVIFLVIIDKTIVKYLYSL